VVAKCETSARVHGGNRFHVHESVAVEFAQRLASAWSHEGRSRTEPDVDVGPLIDEKQLAKVEELVADAAARGARC